MRLQNDINIILGVIKAQDTPQDFCDSPAVKKKSLIKLSIASV